MGRRRSPLTIARAKEIYRQLLELGETSTPILFQRISEKNPRITYSILYQILRFLKSKGLVEQRARGRISYWKVIRVLDENQLDQVLRK
ncbi:MAG: hypothetical protein DRJ52_00855 [Thermoprotei archaeon]|nr:MAG: hypothetical protein DRJ52_00855 [Thermoprotei archaeon]RLF00440.1 MAG: hypothetical protein DRJ63_02570 [Thermoprotei archaeon]